MLLESLSPARVRRARPRVAPAWLPPRPAEPRSPPEPPALPAGPAPLSRPGAIHTKGISVSTKGENLGHSGALGICFMAVVWLWMILIILQAQKLQVCVQSRVLDTMRHHLLRCVENNILLPQGSGVLRLPKENLSEIWL